MSSLKGAKSQAGPMLVICLLVFLGLGVFGVLLFRLGDSGNLLWSFVLWGTIPMAMLYAWGGRLFFPRRSEAEPPWLRYPFQLGMGLFLTVVTSPHLLYVNAWIGPTTKVEIRGNGHSNRWRLLAEGRQPQDLGAGR